jgi:glycine cleavage system aminomethyltransferase T
MFEVLCGNPKSTEFRLHEREESLRVVERQQHASIARHDKTIAHATKRDLGLALSGTIGRTITDVIAVAMQFPIQVPIDGTTWVSMWAR